MQDHLPREKRAAVAAPVTLPPLSPPFIREEDAAYWAHRQIGAKREKEYGGVILSADNRFYATTPIVGKELTFSLRTVLNVDAQHRLLAPPGYALVAFYHSHPASHELVQQTNPGLPNQYIKPHINFFSGYDFVFIVQNRLQFPHAYLSGPDDSLISYAPSGSQAEHQLAQWIDAGRPPNDPAGIYEPPDKVIEKMASLGTLKFLIPCPVWGGWVGQATADWRVFETPEAPVTSDLPLFTHTCPRPGDAVTAALANAGEGLQWGYVLKYLKSDQYIATQPIAAGSETFAPANLFPARADGGLRLASQFRLHGIYYRSRPEPRDFPPIEAWLYISFFAPAQLTAAMTQRVATQALQVPDEALTLYVAPSDGSLLSFKLPPAGAAQPLFDRDAKGHFTDNGAQAAMQAGQLTPRDYVRRLMGVGQLQVEQRGALWREEGMMTDGQAILAGTLAPVLQGPFLSADDAAMHAHESVGRYRDRFYGGYILRNGDNQYFATQLLASDSDPFASPLFFPIGGKGPLVPPQGYGIYARVGVHPLPAAANPDRIARWQWSQEDALLDPQLFSEAQVLSIIGGQATAYLSGAHDSLIRFTRSPDASTLNALHRRLLKANGGNAQLPVRGFKPQELVRQLVRVGELWVIRGNPAWGERGRVEEDWRAGRPVPGRELLRPAILGRVCESAEAAASEALVRLEGWRPSAGRYFAFVLKHRREEGRYVATEWVTVTGRNHMFSLQSLFDVQSPGAHGSGDYRFPGEYQLHGLCYFQPGTASGLRDPETWLQNFFLRPSVLLDVLYEARRRAAGQSPSGLPVFVATQDGALLRFDQNLAASTQVISLAEVTVKLKSGELTAAGFVREVASKLALKVLVKGQCWDREGDVTVHWTPYADYLRRWLGPGFKHVDDAARHAGRMIGRERSRIYGGYILQRQSDGLFFATEPLASNCELFDETWVFPIKEGGETFPENFKIAARYCSRLRPVPAVNLPEVERELYINLFSAQRVASLFHQDARDRRSEYLFCPDGSLLNLTLDGRAEEALLKARLSPTAGAGHGPWGNRVAQQLDSGMLKPADWVRELAGAAQLQVLRASPVWGPPRIVDKNFVPRASIPLPLDIVQASQEPVFSPLFMQADDAVRYALESLGEREWLQGGYLLRVTASDQYMVTLPLARQNFTHLHQVFPQGAVPHGCELAGFYFAAPDQSITGVDDPLHNSFVRPVRVVQGLRICAPAAAGPYLPLYLSFADGALLKYRFDGDSTVLAGIGALEERLQQSRLQLLELVHLLGIKGQLQILLPSAVWDGYGLVTADWLPGERRSVKALPRTDFVMGPVFNDADDAVLYCSRIFKGSPQGQYLSAIRLRRYRVGEEFYSYTAPMVEVEFRASASSILGFFLRKQSGLERIYPQGTQMVAAYQLFRSAEEYPPAPGEEGLRRNFASWRNVDLYTHGRDREEGGQLDMYYLSTLDGALIKFTPDYTRAEDQVLMEHRQWTPGSNPAKVPRISEVLSLLAGRQQLRVLRAGSFWSRRGLISQDLKLKLSQPWDEPIRDRDEL